MQEMEESEGDFMYKGHILTRNAQMEESFQQKHKEVISAVECLDIRFSGFTDDQACNSCFRKKEENLYVYDTASAQREANTAWGPGPA